MLDKKMAKWVITIVAGVVLAFLAERWLTSFDKSIETLQETNVELATSMKESNKSLESSIDRNTAATDSLGLRFGLIDERVIEWLNDHEKRIRELEKK